MRGGGVRDFLLALPRLARLVAALIGDSTVPTSAKLALAAVALYLASPIDLVPDLIPLFGYLDDVLLAALVIDGLLGALDRSLLLRYWPGSAQSLDAAAAVARRLAGWVPLRARARLFRPWSRR